VGRLGQGRLCQGERILDTKLLRDSFAVVAPYGLEVTEYFYAHLFATGGDPVVSMFPPLMGPQRDRLLKALVRIVTDVDDLDKLGAYLAGLGRDHRKFSVQPEHFDLVGASLLATLQHFAGDAWTPEVAGTWAGAYALVAQVMRQALTADDGTPPWWDATVTAKEMPSYDIAIITTRLAQPMEWAPGQSVAAQFEGRPRIWRYLTPANPPRVTRTAEFHLRVIPGGLLSVPLALHAGPGSRLKLGPPVGSLKLDEDSDRDILMVAGSTGLAPMMAMLERLAQRDSPPDVRLYFGAREPGGLYAADRLAKLAAEHDWLTVTLACSAPEEQSPEFEGERGNIVDVVTRGEAWQDRDAYICGSSAMTEAAAGRLMALGMPGPSIHIEDFGWEG